MRFRIVVGCWCLALACGWSTSRGDEPTLPADWYSKGKGVRPMEELKRSLNEEGFSAANVQEFRLLFENSRSDRLAVIERSIQRFIEQKRTSGNSVELLRELAEQLRAQRTLVLDRLVESIGNPLGRLGSLDGASSLINAALMGDDDQELKKLAGVVPEMWRQSGLRVAATMTVERLNRKGFLAKADSGFPRDAIFQELLSVPDPKDSFCGNAWMEKHQAQSLLIGSRSELGGSMLETQLLAIRPGMSYTDLVTKVPQALGNYIRYPKPDLCSRVVDIFEIVKRQGDPLRSNLMPYYLRGIMAAIRREGDPAPYAALIDYVQQGAAGDDAEWSEVCKAGLR